MEVCDEGEGLVGQAQGVMWTLAPLSSPSSFLTLSCLLSVGLSPLAPFPCVPHEPCDASGTVTQCQYLGGCHPHHQTPVNMKHDPGSVN